MHFAPVGNPAREATHREQHRKHRLRNPDRTVNHTRIKIDIRIKLPLDEVRILQGRFLELFGDVQERVVYAQALEEFVAAL